MAYKKRINNMGSISSADSVQLLKEMDALRAELNDIRTKYTALVALLVAGTALGAGYSTGTALAASTFTAD